MPVGHDHETSAAPGDLEIVRRLVNTFDAETGQEDLGSPAELSAWLEEIGLAQGAEASAAELARFVEAREALRSLLLANNGATLSGDASERLNAALAGTAAEVRFAGGAATLEPSGTKPEAALARIALIVRDAMVSGDWARLKVCPADDCEWAFYDRSRNRSRTWCDMQDCGNRSKVRAFRARKSG
jgi:predicted RNA-binding Zn ribbon-like protein